LLTDFRRATLSVVVFDHRAKVLVSNQIIDNPDRIKQQINRLAAEGGTSIDEGLRLGIEELAKAKKETISQAFLLTDGENEHGQQSLPQICRTCYNLTLNTLGFGDHWNQDILEQIADAGGTLSYIQQPDQALEEFGRLFNRIQAVGLTAYLLLSLMPKVRLAELKPIAQGLQIELPVQQEADGRFAVRLGDLMKEVKGCSGEPLRGSVATRRTRQLCKSATMTQLLTRLTYRNYTS